MNTPTARTTVRGFHGTPVTSGDEDSDYGSTHGSTHGNATDKGSARRGRRRLPALHDVVSANCSPVLRPAGGSPAMSGIAKLRMQLEPLSLDTSAASSRASSPMSREIRLPCSPGKGQQPKQTKQARQTKQAEDKEVKLDSGVSGNTSNMSSISTACNTSGDETGPDVAGSAGSGGSGGSGVSGVSGGSRRNGTTSYEIRLESDFVSESVQGGVQGGVHWTVEDGLVADTPGLGLGLGLGPSHSLSHSQSDYKIVDDDPLANFDVTTATDLHAYDKAREEKDQKEVAEEEREEREREEKEKTTKKKKMTADEFEPLRCLGKGSYGTVLLVKQRATGRLYAQKQFKKASLVVQKKLVEQTKTERQILESVNRHPFVVKLFYAFQDREKLYLILEYGQGGELFTHLSAERMFSEPTAAFYMAEMVLALSHLHDTLGVVYRDLKPENCLLDAEGHLLLTDFGLSKVALPGQGSSSSGVGGGGGNGGEDDAACCHSILGTVEYMAPEIVLGQKYGRAVDWWSFGALGYDLLTGNPPFRGRNNAKIQDNIVRQKLVLPYFLSPDAKELLLRLLQKNPRKRLGANMPKDLATIQGHRFFRKIDWKRLEARQLEPPIQPVITDPELAENFAPEFTEMPMSPTLPPASPVLSNKAPGSGAGHRASGRQGGGGSVSGTSYKDDPFGGFSFVASTSLLNESHFPMMV